MMAKLGQWILGLVMFVVICFGFGAGFGACRAGAAVAYRVLSGAP